MRRVLAAMLTVMPILAAGNVDTQDTGSMILFIFLVLLGNVGLFWYGSERVNAYRRQVMVAIEPAHRLALGLLETLAQAEGDPSQDSDEEA